MKTIIIESQKELDALPDSFDEYTYIEIKSADVIHVNKAWGNSSVVAWENSSVVAWENSSVVAWDNSSVVARGNSSVVAWGNSSVEARENSSVEARENSSVEARENSSVVARGNSSVVAWDNSSVVAWGNSSVVAWDTSTLHSYSGKGQLFGNSVGFSKGGELSKSDNATVIVPKKPKTLDEWLVVHGIQPSDSITLYKRVSKDLLTQENTKNETKWEIGSELTHPNWDPAGQECGEGKFHACPKPYFADEFRSKRGDRYIAVEIKKEDLYVWTDNPQYPHKIGFRKGKVVYECDRHGEKK